MAGRPRRRDPSRLGAFEKVGAWLGIWTPHRDAVVPGPPRRKIALAALFALVIAGGAAALIAPRIERGKAERSAAERHRHARIEAARRRRLAEEGVQHSGRGGRRVRRLAQARRFAPGGRSLAISSEPSPGTRAHASKRGSWTGRCSRPSARSTHPRDGGWSGTPAPAARTMTALPSRAVAATAGSWLATPSTRRSTTGAFALNGAGVPGAGGGCRAAHLLTRRSTPRRSGTPERRPIVCSRRPRRWRWRSGWRGRYGACTSWRRQTGPGG